MSQERGEKYREQGVTSVLEIQDHGRMDGKNDAPKPGCLDGLADRMNAALGGFYHRLGLSVGGSPYITVVCTFFLCILLAGGLGFPGLANESRGDKLWVPTNTQAQADKRFVDQHYGNGARIGLVISSDPDGGDVLTPKFMNNLKSLYDELQTVTAEYGNMTLTWENQCHRYGPYCVFSSVFDVFGDDASEWDTKEKILARINTKPLLSPKTGAAVMLDGVIGLPVYDADGKMTSATAARLYFQTKNTEVVKDGDTIDERGDAYEQGVLDLLNAGKDDLSLTYLVSRSFSDEFGSAIQGDITKLQVAFMLILAYAALMLSKWTEGCVGSRVGLTLMGILSIGMSIASSYGFCAYLGLFYSPLMNVLPFLLLGIGVDDMFVIVNAYDLTDASQDVRARIAQTLYTAGASITVTSMTDVFAFLIGSNTSLPALRNFCFYAAFGIFFDFLYQVTFFVAWLTLDERRRANKKGDCAFCLSCPPEACCACCKPRADNKGVMQVWMGDVMGGFLTKPAVKVAVLIGFLGIAAAGIAGTAIIEVDADSNDFIPPGSYVRDFIGQNRDWFSTVGDSVAVYTLPGVDYHTSAGRKLMLDTAAAFQGDPRVAPDSVSSWAVDFATAKPDVADADYYLELDKYLAGAGKRYQSNVVWKDPKDPSKGIHTTRIEGNHVFVIKSTEKVKAMDSLRSSVSGVEGNADGSVFAYAGEWLSYEQYKAIENEAIRNISFTLLTMLCIIAALIVNPAAVLTVFAVIALVIIDIIGFMHFWGLTIDSVTVIMLVIALGLSVDYSAHIGRAFMEEQGTPNERLVKCLGHMGVAVLNGAFSTFLAVIILGSSESYVFVTFFRQLFLCTTLGLSHGLILLPVLMSIVAPNPYTHSTITGAAK